MRFWQIEICIQNYTAHSIFQFQDPGEDAEYEDLCVRIFCQRDGAVEVEEIRDCRGGGNRRRSERLEREVFAPTSVSHEFNTPESEVS